MLPIIILAPCLCWAVRIRTCDGVQGGDGECEDGGQVEVPAQADLDKQGSRVQVNLGKAEFGRSQVLQRDTGLRAWVLYSLALWPGLIHEYGCFREEE